MSFQTSAVIWHSWPSHPCLPCQETESISKQLQENWLFDNLCNFSSYRLLWNMIVYRLWFHCRNLRLLIKALHQQWALAVFCHLSKSSQNTGFFTLSRTFERIFFISNWQHDHYPTSLKQQQMKVHIYSAYCKTQRVIQNLMKKREASYPCAMLLC